VKTLLILTSTTSVVCYIKPDENQSEGRGPERRPKHCGLHMRKEDIVKKLLMLAEARLAEMCCSERTGCDVFASFCVSCENTNGGRTNEKNNNTTKFLQGEYAP
jgi:hypothetical protein